MKIIAYPAIDLKDGACVRLRRGDMDQATVYSDNPGAQALAWQEAGFAWVHVVDLNGAFAGHPVNGEAVADILASVTIPVQLGGGIRDLAGIARWLEAGVERVILGSAAAKNPSLVIETCREFPGRIAVGIDARDGFVATEGWAETSSLPAPELARHFEGAGVVAIDAKQTTRHDWSVFSHGGRSNTGRDVLDWAREVEALGAGEILLTSMDRDGTGQGFDLDLLHAVCCAVRIPVIASGGVGTLRHFIDGARAGATGLLAASVFHFGTFTVGQVKQVLHEAGMPVRLPRAAA